MTEAFYITAILASLYFAVRIVNSESQSKPWRDLILMGISLAVAVMLRQVFLLFIPLLFIWIGWTKRTAIAHLVVPAAILIGAILPVTWFNYTQFDRFVLLNTNAVFAFYWGNHPIYGTEFVPILTPDMERYQDLIPRSLWTLDEASLDQELLRRGLGFIAEDPLRYVQLSLSRIPHYFVFWPSVRSGALSNFSRVGSFGILMPFMFSGLVLAWKHQRSSQQNLLLIFIAIYTLIHVLTWTLIRYRLPVDAILIVFAGLALDHLHQYVKARRSD